MMNTWKQIRRMKSALAVNTLLYYLKQLWVIKNFISDRCYASEGLKKGISILCLILKQAYEAVGKLCYLILFVLLPVLWAAQRNPMIEPMAMSMQILFFMSCVIGSFADSYLFSMTREKYTCIKYMHMNVKEYVISSFLDRYVTYYMYMLPGCLVLSYLLKQTWVEGLIVFVMLVSFRMIGEATILKVYERTEKVIVRALPYQWFLILVGTLLAYGPLVLELPAWVGTVLLHPLTVCVSAIGGILGAWYICKGYQGYESDYRYSLDENFMVSVMMKNSATSSFKEVEVKERDHQLSASAQRKVDRKSGYAFMNELFFQRHKRQLLRPLTYRLASILAAFLFAVAFYMADQTNAVLISQNMSASLLPASLYLMSFMTIADKGCRAMFYDCDKEMLRYSYYRQPDIILHTFKIRMLRLSLYDLIIGLAVCAAAILYCLICKTPVVTLDMALFCIVILLLSIFFTVHHLCLYYIFQPYAGNLQIKNPFFMIMNGIVFTICFLCMSLDVGNLMFTLAVMSVTIIYIIGSIVLVYRFAPNTFRIK